MRIGKVGAESWMPVLLRTQVLSASHDYTDNSTDDVFLERDKRLDWSAFQLKGSDASMDLWPMVSHVQKPNWLSARLVNAPPPPTPRLPAVLAATHLSLHRRPLPRIAFPPPFRRTALSGSHTWCSAGAESDTFCGC